MDGLISAFTQTRRWAKILGIVFIVGFVFDILSFSLIEIATGILTGLIPGTLLILYSQTVSRIEQTDTSVISEIEAACAQQGRFFKYLGIISAVTLLIFVFFVGPSLLGFLR